MVWDTSDYLLLSVNANVSKDNTGKYIISATALTAGKVQAVLGHFDGLTISCMLVETKSQRKWSAGHLEAAHI